MVTAIGIMLIAVWTLVIYGINKRYSDRVRPEHVAMGAAMGGDTGDFHGTRENPSTDPAYMSASFSIYHHDD